MYQRPLLSRQEQLAITAVSSRINGMFDRGKRLTYILAFMVENAMLLKEVNEHRAALGIEPLQVHDIDANRVG